MKYCEIIIGPPGSGKSTYVDKKIDLLKDRNPYLINLDPGNINTRHYDYSITEKYTVNQYQKEFNKGPNASTKDILSEFVSDLNSFYYEKLDDNVCYLIIDMPGQVEFLINGDSMSNLISLFTRKGYSVSVICLIDLVFFNHSPLSSYLFTLICVSLLEVPYVCVISKCDNFDKIGFNYDLEKITKLDIFNEKVNDKFTQSIIQFLVENPLFRYEILDYDNENTLKYLQYIIDQSSGYIYDEDYSTDYSKLDFEDLFSKYKIKD